MSTARVSRASGFDGAKLTGLSAVVLAGGKSSRMGSPKAFLDFGGEPLLTRITGRLAEVAETVVVVAAADQPLPALPEAVVVVRDPVSGKGPLVGIAAGLAALSGHASRAGRARVAFVSSTDAPFLHPALVRRLYALAEEGYENVVPHVGGHYHPLSALYALEARAVIADLLAEDRLRPFFVFERMRTLVADRALLLHDEALRAADPRLRSLLNVNTPEEYAAALAEEGAR